MLRLTITFRKYENLTSNTIRGAFHKPNYAQRQSYTFCAKLLRLKQLLISLAHGFAPNFTLYEINPLKKKFNLKYKQIIYRVGNLALTRADVSRFPLENKINKFFSCEKIVKKLCSNFLSICVI